jgi:hypothetical protein
VQADKGKTIAITTSNVYSKRVHTFPAAKNFLMLPKYPTDKYKKSLKNTKTMQLNRRQRKIKIPSPKGTFTPTLKGQLK